MHRSTPIRTAVLGYGLAGSVFHAPALAADARFSLDVISTSDPGRRAQAKEQYPLAQLLPSAEEVLSAPGMLELVVIATPPATHAPLAHAALEAGLAVVVDKPFTTSAAEGRDLINHARSLGAVLTCYQNRRWDGEILTLKKLLAEDRLGQVRRFESRLERWSPETVKPWKAAATAAEGGGVLFDLGTHLIDQALHLFGPVNDVYGELDARRLQEKADDDVFVALSHESGVRSHLSMNLAAPQAGPRLLVQGSKAGYLKWTADGQEAQVQSGILPGDPRYGSDPREKWGRLGIGSGSVPVPTERGDFPRFYALLASAIRQDGAVPVDPGDAVQALEIIEALRRTPRRR